VSRPSFINWVVLVLTFVKDELWQLVDALCSILCMTSSYRISNCYLLSCGAYARYTVYRSTDRLYLE
jgi:hypothetical protein